MIWIQQELWCYSGFAVSICLDPKQRVSVSPAGTTLDYMDREDNVLFGVELLNLLVIGLNQSGQVTTKLSVRIFDKCTWISLSLGSCLIQMFHSRLRHWLANSVQSASWPCFFLPPLRLEEGLPRRSLGAKLRKEICLVQGNWGHKGRRTMEGRAGFFFLFCKSFKIIVLLLFYDMCHQDLFDL